MSSEWKTFFSPRARQLLDENLAMTSRFLDSLVDKSLLEKSDVSTITEAQGRRDRVNTLVRFLSRNESAESAQNFCEALVEDESVGSQALLAKKLNPAMWNNLDQSSKGFAGTEKSREDVALEMEKSAKYLCRVGEYDQALTLLFRAKAIEELELGGRYERVASLLYEIAYAKSEKSKLVDFINETTCRKSKEVIDTVKEAIAIWRRLMGEENLKRLGLSLLLCSFHLSAYRNSLANFKKENASLRAEMSPDAASRQGTDMAKESVAIFQRLDDGEHVAEAYMVWGLQYDNHDQQQLQYLQKGLSICLESCGQYHPLTSRFKLNIGIFYEYAKDYQRAYKNFKEWNEINEEVLGPAHPKTARSRRTLQEARYADMK